MSTRTNHQLFETIWDWAILLALIAIFAGVMFVIATEVSDPTPPQPLDPQTEVQQLRDRIEALERCSEGADRSLMELSYSTQQLRSRIEALEKRQP